MNFSSLWLPPQAENRRQQSEILIGSGFRSVFKKITHIHADPVSEHWTSIARVMPMHHLFFKAYDFYKSNLSCIPFHAEPFLDVKNFDKAGMHLLAEGERMLEGGCFDFTASKCCSTFYEVVQRLQSWMSCYCGREYSSHSTGSKGSSTQCPNPPVSHYSIRL